MPYMVAKKVQKKARNLQTNFRRKRVKEKSHCERIKNTSKLLCIVNVPPLDIVRAVVPLFLSLFSPKDPVNASEDESTKCPK